MRSFKFYIRMDGLVYGPYSLQEYHDLNVPSDTEVMEESVGEWMLASDYPSYEELNAWENGYKLMPDGSIEKIKEETHEETGYDEMTAAQKACGEPFYLDAHDGNVFSATSTYNKGYNSVPQSGWSWGAFMFNWIWAIFNGIYWPIIIIIIALVPHIGGLTALAFCIVLGIKGNEWAWHAKLWDSVEHFNDIQHRWSVAAKIYMLAVIGCITIVSLI